MVYSFIELKVLNNVIHTYISELRVGRNSALFAWVIISRSLSMCGEHIFQVGFHCIYFHLFVYYINAISALVTLHHYTKILIINKFTTTHLQLGKPCSSSPVKKGTCRFSKIWEACTKSPIEHNWHKHWIAKTVYGNAVTNIDHVTCILRTNKQICIRKL